MTMAPGPFVLLQMCWQLSLGSIYSCIHKFPLGNLRARLLLPTLLEFPLGKILLIFSIPFQDVMPSTATQQQPGPTSVNTPMEGGKANL